MPDYYKITFPNGETVKDTVKNEQGKLVDQDVDVYAYFKNEVKPSASSQWTTDDTNRRINIHIPFALVAENIRISSTLANRLGKRLGPDTEAELLEKFGTSFYKQQVANQEVLTAARRTLGAIVPQDVPRDTSGIDLSQKPSKVMQDMLGGSGPGVCLGRTHDEPESLTALEEAIDSGAAGLLFVEEFLTDEQRDLDAYMDVSNNDPDNFKFGVLEQRLEQLQNSHKVNWFKVLKKAKAKGVKVYGIDSGEGREYAGPLTDAVKGEKPAEIDSMGERRVSGMNKVTYDVMQAALQDRANAGKKFLAVVGAKHSNTHEGGIPGVSQMFGCAAVRLDPNNKAALKIDPENKSLRGMPPLDEQLYVDYAMLDGARRNPEASAATLRKEALAQAKLLKANRELPTADEQIFITNYVAQAKNNPKLKNKDPELLRTAALKVAKAKTQTGDLPTGGPMTALLDEGAMVGEVAAAETLLKDIKAAINDNDPAKLKSLLKKNKTALTLKDEKGRSVLQLAVASKDAALIAAVCEKWPNAAAVDPPDENGNTALHLAVGIRPEGDAAKKKQAGLVQALIAGGADVNRVNRTGATALHLVGKTDNEKASEKLLAAGADVKIKDARGWTALDAAVAGTSVTVEKMYYDQRKATPTENHDNATTIERLMAATLCEDPADRQKVQAAFEKLYMIPELQPILKLASLAASNKRAPLQLPPPVKPITAPRIVVAAGDNVQNLYEQPQSQRQQYPQGAFDEGASIVMVANDSTNDFAGVLIHELTHMATHIMYGDEVEPFDQADGVAKQAYIDAIEADVKMMNLLNPDDPVEKKIKERISGRMLKYALDGRPNDKGVLQEFIVGVPQLIAEFGQDIVRKFAPNLFATFSEFSQKCDREAKEGDRFEDARDWVDDSILHLPPPTFEPPLPPHEQVVKPTNDSLKVDKLIETIKADYLSKHGNKQPPVGTVAFDGSAFTLDANAMKELDKKLVKVKEGLKKSLAADRLTLPVSMDEWRKLVQTAADLTHSTSAKDLKTAIEANADTWLMQAKVDYVSKKAFSGTPMTEVELAETIALNAEDQSDGGTANFDFNVNPDKHASLVKKLTKDLVDLPSDKRDTIEKQGTLMDSIVSNITGSKTAGVFHRTASCFSVSTIDPRHVSIEVKNARKKWLQVLKSLGT